MSTGPDEERRPPEPTFADVMNGFSFDSGRKSKRRLWGRRRAEDAERRTDPSPGPISGGQSEPVDDGHAGAPERGYYDGVSYGQTLELQSHQTDGGSSSVRPYTWTRGRTRTGYQLEIETLIATSQRGREQMAVLQVEHRAVAQLCEQARSVAEVAALLRVPLGVARVLVGDMAGLGLVAVHQSVSANGDVPDLALMERVLSGLRRL